MVLLRLKKIVIYPVQKPHHFADHAVLNGADLRAYFIKNCTGEYLWWVNSFNYYHYPVVKDFAYAAMMTNSWVSLQRFPSLWSIEVPRREAFILAVQSKNTHYTTKIYTINLLLYPIYLTLQPWRLLSKLSHRIAVVMSLQISWIGQTISWWSDSKANDHHPPSEGVTKWTDTLWEIQVFVITFIRGSVKQPGPAAAAAELLLRCLDI